MYEIVFDEKAIDYLKRLRKEMRKRIWERVMELKEDPRKKGKKLKGINSYRIRVGDYRIIYDINEKKKRVEILVLGKRSNIYKKIK